MKHKNTKLLDQLKELSRYDPLIRHYEEDGEELTEIMDIPFCKGRFLRYKDVVKLLKGGS
jgi:hypothetical protein